MSCWWYSDQKYYSYRMFMLQCLSLFPCVTKIMRHFRVRKLHQKIYASCNCYSWANMLVITQHFVQLCKETEISLRLTDIHLLHCYFWHIIRHASYFHFFSFLRRFSCQFDADIKLVILTYNGTETSRSRVSFFASHVKKTSTLFYFRTEIVFCYPVFRDKLSDIGQLTAS